ncbi:ThiF family adenylyltransferase [Bacteroidota bacterium]
MKDVNFQPEELSRYQRHLAIPDIGYNGQARLKAASVLVVGAGGLGCPALLYLTASGIGKIGIVDHDIVESSNLQRQVLYQTNDIGKLKSPIVSERLNDLNPYVKIKSYTDKLQPSNVIEIFKGFDIIIDGTDNFETRYLINDACVVFGKPFVYGAISRFEGQFSVFNYKNGPTLRCLFPERGNSNNIPSCEINGVMGILPGMIGTMQATETIKMITGIGKVASGRLITYDALTHEIGSFTIKADPINKNVSVKNKY